MTLRQDVTLRQGDRPDGFSKPISAHVHLHTCLLVSLQFLPCSQLASVHPVLQEVFLLGGGRRGVQGQDAGEGEPTHFPSGNPPLLPARLLLLEGKQPPGNFYSFPSNFDQLALKGPFLYKWFVPPTAVNGGTSRCCRGLGGGCLMPGGCRERGQIWSSHLLRNPSSSLPL